MHSQHSYRLLRMRGALALAVTLMVATIALPSTSGAKSQPKCLFVSSYHKGYSWSDGVERGLRSVLAGQCEIKQFDMDTKRHKSEKEKMAAALEAKTLVEQWKPDVVITADDNAAKYFIQPYFRDHAIPIVFSGVNWTAREYGFPYSNVTGIVEVAPIQPMLLKARDIAEGSRAFYLGADTLTERKNLARFQGAAAELDMALESRLATSLADWTEGLKKAQSFDFVIMGSNSGIKKWDAAAAVRSAMQYSKKLSVTNHDWMMPVTMFGMTKVPEEHGEWGAESALAILSGTSPQDIPIVSNRRWDLWMNKDLLNAAGVTLPRSLRRKAKRSASATH
ncbi:MAG: ABC-type uncharacterized transport system substrate-binding protein [Gammaproteobacteria bacterium]|jgi:ABC-type uncharacterized transport system substrate-binding protein